MTRKTIDQELDWARTEGPVRTLVIPPCPELLTRLQAAMKAEDADWDEVSAIANADVAMAATLVRAANSPMYARSAATHSVDQAMSLLGLRQTALQLMQFLTVRSLPTNHPALESFWENSARRALAMGYIARQLYGTPPDLAHSFGLFCDVGMPVLMQGLRGYGGTLVEGRSRQDRSLIETEQTNHQTDHAIVGALVARTWGLPVPLKHGIRLHHEEGVLADDGIDKVTRELIATCHVAEHLVHAYQGVESNRDWDAHGEASLAQLEVSPAELLNWADTLHDSFDAVAAG